MQLVSIPTCKKEKYWIPPLSSTASLGITGLVIIWYVFGNIPLIFFLSWCHVMYLNSFVVSITSTKFQCVIKGRILWLIIVFFWEKITWYGLAFVIYLITMQFLGVFFFNISTFLPYNRKSVLKEGYPSLERTLKWSNIFTANVAFFFCLMPINNQQRY